MRKLLLTAAVFLFAIAVTFACTSAPATEPASSQQPANAPGGLTFVSPIKTPPPGTTATPDATTTPWPMQPPVVIELALFTPIVVNQPVTLTINIQPRQEIVEPLLGIVVQASGARNVQTYTMTLPTIASDELRQVTQPLSVPGDEGRYMISAFLTDGRRGATYHRVLYLAVSEGNVVLNPTPRPPDAPPTIVLTDSTRTVLPTRTRQAPVTTEP
jgi:hypothetical protein